MNDVRHRWRWAVASVLIGLLVSGCVATLLISRPVVYAARVTLSATTESGAPLGEMSTARLSAVGAAATSPAVLQEVAAAVPAGDTPAQLATRVGVETITSYGVVRLTVQSTTPERAAGEASALADSVVQRRPLGADAELHVAEGSLETYIVGPDGLLVAGLAVLAGTLAGLAVAVLARLLRPAMAIAVGGFGIAAVAAIRGLGYALAVPTPSAANLSEDRLQDFRDATYFPIREFLAGGDPYRPSAMFANWPVRQEFDLYQPYHLLIHLPFALPTYHVAAIAYALFVLAQLVLLAAATAQQLGKRFDVPPIAAAGLLSAFLVSSMVGNTQLYVGQVNTLIAIGMAAALFYRRSHPAWAAVGLAAAWLKPQFGLPLAVLLAAGGSARVALRGTIVAALASLPVAVLLVVREGGIGNFLGVIAENLEYAQNTGYGAVDSPTTSRIDVAAVVYRMTGLTVAGGELLAAVLVLGVTVYLTRALLRRTEELSRSAVDLLICLAVLVSIVHQPGDVLVAFPAAVVLGVAWWRGPRFSYGALPLVLALALVAFPFDHFGVVHTRLSAIFGSGFGVTVDGAALIVAWLLLAGYAWQLSTTRDADLAPDRPTPTPLPKATPVDR